MIICVCVCVGGLNAALGDVWHVLPVPADGAVLPAQLPAAQCEVARAVAATQGPL